MPISLDVYTNDVIKHIKAINPQTILDVGPGIGKYYDIVKSVNPNTICDAVEAESSYIKKYNLQTKYRKVFNEDIVNFVKTNKNDKYDLCIMGDVLEHLFLYEAISVLDAIAYKTKFIMIVWPTNLPQDYEWESTFEMHKSNIKLSDLSRFNIQIYKKTFAFYRNNLPIDMHYAIIAGHTTADCNSLRTFQIENNTVVNDV